MGGNVTHMGFVFRLSPTLEKFIVHMQIPNHPPEIPNPTLLLPSILDEDTQSMCHFVLCFEGFAHSVLTVFFIA